jgi:hypothetical protein
MASIEYTHFTVQMRYLPNFTVQILEPHFILQLVNQGFAEEVVEMSV